MLKENDSERRQVNANVWHAAGYTGKGVKILLLDEGGDARENMKDWYHEPDVLKGFWAFQAIGYLGKHGYIGGYPNGTFRPNEGMERAQFAAVIYPMAKEIEELKAEVKALKGE
ncbi:S-layer homology domain-containing protein [Salibacterium sp. K-3]